MNMKTHDVQLHQTHAEAEDHIRTHGWLRPLRQRATAILPAGGGWFWTLEVRPPQARRSVDYSQDGRRLCSAAAHRESARLQVELEETLAALVATYDARPARSDGDWTILSGPGERLRAHPSGATILRDGRRWEFFPADGGKYTTHRSMKAAKAQIR